jgi:hypothetical protein
MTGDLVFCTQDGNRLASRIVVREKRLSKRLEIMLAAGRQLMPFVVILLVIRSYKLGYRAGRRSVLR